MPRQPTTWLHVSGYLFLLRRIGCALLNEDVQATRGRVRALTIGCVLAAIALAAGAVLAVLRPQAALDRAQLVLAKESGALYVRVGDTWHPVLNLASARLIAETAAHPQPVSESDLVGAKRGAPLGIPGAPQSLGRPLSAEETAWSICDDDDTGGTTVAVGRTEGSAIGRLASGQAILVSPASGSPTYLLYRGQRAVVDLADVAVSRALRLEGHAPRIVSQSLLGAVPEAPPIRIPRIRGAGGKAAALPGFRVGSVLRITRADGDEYYAVLAGGVQRIGQVAADLLRFSDSQGTASTVTVAPDAIRSAPIIDELPMAGFPDRAPALPDDGGILCATWQPAQFGQTDAAFLTGNRLPVPTGQTPVTLSQADGRGPALDAVYLPPGRSVYVRGNGRVGTRYLVTDTGVRFAIHDDDAAHDLGLAAANPAPWPVLAALPSGPELGRQNASIARDTAACAP